jgi:hypothetical protein
MSQTRQSFRAFVFVVSVLALSAVAGAQATRTWVSGVGDDVNPCSRTAPCKTFAGAIPKTAINGEINCRNGGGYGVATITKSITIDCENEQAGILASGTNGITINLSIVDGTDPLHTVRLRGLVINGAGASGFVGANPIGTRTGLDGIRVLTGDGTAPTVIVEDVVVDGFTQDGLEWASNGGTLIVKDSSFRNNAQRGIYVDSGGANAVYAQIHNTTTDYNQEGVRFDDNVRGSVTNSRAASNTLNGYVCFPQGTGSTEMSVSGSAAANNLQWGIVAGGTGAATCTLVASNNEVTHNALNAFQVNAGGTLLSNGRNRTVGASMAPTGAATEQ